MKVGPLFGPDHFELCLANAVLFFNPLLISLLLGHFCWCLPLGRELEDAGKLSRRVGCPDVLIHPLSYTSPRASSIWEAVPSSRSALSACNCQSPWGTRPSVCYSRQDRPFNLTISDPPNPDLGRPQVRSFLSAQTPRAR